MTCITSILRLECLVCNHFEVENEEIVDFYASFGGEHLLCKTLLVGWESIWDSRNNMILVVLYQQTVIQSINELKPFWKLYTNKNHGESRGQGGEYSNKFRPIAQWCHYVYRRIIRIRSHWTMMDFIGIGGGIINERFFYDTIVYSYDADNTINPFKNVGSLVRNACSKVPSGSEVFTGMLIPIIISFS